ncbi:MAG: Methyltransferase type 12 [Microgenomates group bacterium GW2011_GWC1_43_13]|nr:MAG: Methyltransferase type 12 [Microgenomates group bacterium GW2011_GWC1_43_13]
MTRNTSVKKHFDTVAKSYDYYKNKNSFYYDNLKKLLDKLIPKNKKVFEVGCGTGELLNHLRSKYGYGYDISPEMVSISRQKFSNSKNLTFSTEWPKEKFDYIFMSDVIEHLESPKKTFSEIVKLMHEESIFICTMANPVWEPLLMIAELLNLKMPEGPHKRIAFGDLQSVMKSIGLKTIRHDYKLLVPIKIPILTSFANKYLEKALKKLAFIEYFVAVKA